MRARRGSPAPAEIAAQTPAGRDRAIDVIRIVSLLVVVAGHSVMAVSMIRDDVLIWDNLLATSTWGAPLTWIFQVMPLFFFAGTAAGVASWRPGASWGGWLMRRCVRLYRPVFYYLAFWAVALAGLRPILPEHVYDPIAGVSIQLLWFLGAYVLVLAAVPLLSRIGTAARLATGVAGVYAMAAVVDAIRVHNPAAAPLGAANLLVWVIPGMFGVAYRRSLLSGRAALVTGLVMVGVNVSLCRYGPYDPSLVGVDGQRLANMAPPSLLMAGHAIMICALAVAAAPVIARWARRPRVWWLTVLGNSGAMTLYLWHLPALLGMHLLFDVAGWPRLPGQPHLVALGVVQLTLMTVLVGALFVALRPLETRTLPWWDGVVAEPSGRKSAAVGALVCAASAALLASVKWGLKDDGVFCVAVMLAGVITARRLAGHTADTPEPVATRPGSQLDVGVLG